jgi:hypothetical protein
VCAPHFRGLSVPVLFWAASTQLPRFEIFAMLCIRRERASGRASVIVWTQLHQGPGSTTNLERLCLITWTRVQPLPCVPSDSSY